MRKRILIYLFLLGLVLMFTGVMTYLPGSSGADVIVRGRIVTHDGRPLAQEEVELILPATYGLSASERQNPAGFGHETRSEQTTTDSDGGFVHSFGFAVYHQDIFLGIRIPGRPPAVVFYMRVPSVSREYYYVDARQGRYRVFSEDGVEIQEAKTPTTLTVHEELGSSSGMKWIAAVVELRYPSTLTTPE